MDLKEEEILGSSVSTHWYYVSKSKAILKLLQPFSVGSVLDVGAGSGIFSKFLLDMGVATSVRCLDTGYPFDCKLETYNGKKISFVKSVEKIDETIILMIDVLEHIDDDHDFLKHYVDRVPDGSYVLMSVPAFNFLWSGHDVFLEHKRRYTLPELESLAISSGLRVVQGRYFFGLLFPFITLMRLINRILFNIGKLSEKSDLRKASEFQNKFLIAIHALELKTFFYFNRWFGLTAFCLAQK